jgi:hypothetical protein
MLHYEGTFTGVFHPGRSLSDAHGYEYKNYSWDILDIQIDRQLHYRDVGEEKAGDFWYAPIINPRKKFNLFNGTHAHISIRNERNEFMSVPVHDVLIYLHAGNRAPNHSPIRERNFEKVGEGFYQAKGKIRFSVPGIAPTIVAKAQIINAQDITVDGNQKNTPIVINPSEQFKPLTTAGNTIDTHTTEPTPPPPPPPPATPIRHQKNWNWLAWLIAFAGILILFANLPWLGVIIAAAVLSYAVRNKSRASSEVSFSFWNYLLLFGAGILIYQYWGSNRTLAYAFLFLALAYSGTRVATPLWRWVFTIIMIIGLFIGASNFLKDLHYIDETPVVNDSDSSFVRIRDVETDDSDKYVSDDSVYHHEMRWVDFSSRKYQGEYPTTWKEFQRARAFHNSLTQLTGIQNEMQYWNFVYSKMVESDNKRIDSLVNLFEEKRKAKSLNTSETAEMVITFIQEIPYVLVHEGSCSEAMQSGGFVYTYHAEGKPCLPNIVAGVQSPYEFAHNLEGDCDTRSLLGFAILSRMNIPVSVWISPTYGHSIMGVGAPAGGYNFKNIQGVRHYAVELTNKGFRLGMIAPEHTDMDNWSIALYKN